MGLMDGALGNNAKGGRSLGKEWGRWVEHEESIGQVGIIHEKCAGLIQSYTFCLYKLMTIFRIKYG